MEKQYILFDTGKGCLVFLLMSLIGTAAAFYIALALFSENQWLAFASFFVTTLGAVLVSSHLDKKLHRKQLNDQKKHPNDVN